jgi:hypothetical protein
MEGVVITREILFDILDEFGKRRPPLPEIGNGFRGDFPAFGEPFFKSLVHLFV